MTLFINGTEVTRVKGKPPKDGGAVGFAAWSNEDKRMTATFDNLIVSEPAE